jgi:hypothetical protein
MRYTAIPGMNKTATITAASSRMRISLVRAEISR